MAVENKLRLSNAMPTEPSFSIMFRGYSRREVDQYAHLAESQLAASVVEKQELAARVQNLADQLAQAHTELVELRRRPGPNDKLNFRHLGPRVEQILAEAERQADAVRASAADGVAQERERLHADLERARQAHERAVREFEDGVHVRRVEEDKAIAQRLEAVRKEVSDAQSHASKLRSEADLALAASQSESARITAAAQSSADKVRGESSEHSRTVRSKAEQEAAAIALDAEAYARQTREEAEQQAHETRAQAEQHAHQTIAAAEQTAKQLRQQAEEQAAQVRLAAEKHAQRMYSGPGSSFRLDVAQDKSGTVAMDKAGDKAGDKSGDKDGASPDMAGADAADLDGAGPRHRANVRAQPTG